MTYGSGFRGEAPAGKRLVSDENLTELKDSNKVALITGITGQKGSYLCELLPEKGVHGARNGAAH
jgi:hypothetical protein